MRTSIIRSSSSRAGRQRAARAPTRPRGRRRARPRTRSRRSSTRSPGAGRWPSAAVTSPPTVVASVSHVVLQQRRRIVHGHAAGKADAAVGQRLGHRIAGLELVADVAEQLREHVLERQQSGGAAELVDDERLMRSALAQVAQDAVGGHALVDAGDRPDQARPASSPVPSSLTSQRTRSLVCSDADDVVDRVAVDRQPGDTGSARRCRSPRSAACRCRAPRSCGAAPSAASPAAGSGAARAAGGGARRARAGRRRGSRRSAARSPPASGCAGAPGAARRAAAAAAGRCRSAT